MKKKGREQGGRGGRGGRQGGGFRCETNDSTLILTIVVLLLLNNLTSICILKHTAS